MASGGWGRRQDASEEGAVTWEAGLERVPWTCARSSLALPTLRPQGGDPHISNHPASVSRAVGCLGSVECKPQGLLESAFSSAHGFLLKEAPLPKAGGILLALLQERMWTRFCPEESDPAYSV